MPVIGRRQAAPGLSRINHPILCDGNGWVNPFNYSRFPTACFDITQKSMAVHVGTGDSYIQGFGKDLAGIVGDPFNIKVIQRPKLLQHFSFIQQIDQTHAIVSFQN
ncbi:hypothetical protein SDC9_155992 [bioreactor metagenome]|uniref:Uncharacterized protein n=1 Tax=bioreactor metagenome TaxID=1076179 RepID=A0A645F3I1_9ZZZZ